MARDRSSPFSRKHRRYWLTVTGGMILIMAINVGLGVWLYDTSPRRLPTVVQPPGIDGGVEEVHALAPDGGVSLDAGAATTARP